MISVIIPTLNGGERFVRLLEALTVQTVAPQEILVIDSGSTDDTLAAAKKYGAMVHSIRQEEFDHGGTRSMAAGLTAGEFLVFMTQDAVPADKDALRALLAPLKESRVAAVYGRQLPFSGASVFARHLRQFNYPENSSLKCWEHRKTYGFKTAFISNSFAAYRRSLLQEIGFFQDGLLFGEDALAGAALIRRGYCIAYAADARVLHSHNYSVFQEFRRYFDIGVFHADHKHILADFGKPTGEGQRYVLSEIRQLIEDKNFFYLPESILRNSMKLLAYNLGKKYSILPRRLAVLCSLNRGWWTKHCS